MVVGGAYSGAEIAVDLATKAKQVVTVIDKPFWVLPRRIPKTPQQPDVRLPADLVFYKRSTRTTPGEIVFPTTTANKGKHAYFAKIFGDQSEYHEHLKMDSESIDPARVII